MKQWESHEFKSGSRMESMIGWVVWRVALLAVVLTTTFNTHAQAVRYIHTDGLGSVAVVTDEQRNIVERREYEPYGATLAAVKDGPGFTGHVSDAQTGLSYMQQRYYDPGLGRFLSVDPVATDFVAAQNFNRYNYAANNPYKFIDPDGREIRFAPGFPVEFYRNAESAIRFLIANDLAGSVAEVHASRAVVTISPTEDRNNVFQNRYDGRNPGARTIYWADKVAMEFVDPATGKLGALSPAVALGHEIEHAANDVGDRDQFATDILTEDVQYKSVEERNVIENFEHPAAEKLGQPQRDRYSVPAQSVPFSCSATSC